MSQRKETLTRWAIRSVFTSDAVIAVSIALWVTVVPLRLWVLTTGVTGPVEYHMFPHWLQWLTALVWTAQVWAFATGLRSGRVWAAAGMMLAFAVAGLEWSDGLPTVSAQWAATGIVQSWLLFRIIIRNHSSNV